MSPIGDGPSAQGAASQGSGRAAKVSARPVPDSGWAGHWTWRAAHEQDEPGTPTPRACRTEASTPRALGSTRPNNIVVAPLVTTLSGDVGVDRMIDLALTESSTSLTSFNNVRDRSNPTAHRTIASRGPTAADLFSMPHGYRWLGSSQYGH